MKRLVLILPLVLLLSSCPHHGIHHAQAPSQDEVEDAILPAPAVLTSFEDWGKVVLILGYGYNDEGFVSAAKEFIERTYGFFDAGGNVAMYVYPDDFMRYGQASISELKEKVARIDEGLEEGDTRVRALISFGAPEKLHAAINKVKDSLSEGKDFTVLSFFPQDDVLAIENASDIVLDYVSGSETEMEEEIKSYHEGEALLEHSLDALFHGVVQERSDDLLSLTRTLAGTDAVEYYTDRESMLRAHNHFVIN